MEITEFRIENYKSFYDSGTISLTPGFNIIVGQNNAGKTAITEALSLRFEANLHRSMQTFPKKNFISTYGNDSIVTLVIKVTDKELIDCINSISRSFDVFVGSKTGNYQDLGNKFIEHFQTGCSVEIVYNPSYLFNKLSSNSFPSCKLLNTPAGNEDSGFIRFKLNELNEIVRIEDSIHSAKQSNNDLARMLYNYIHPRIYAFKAERLAIGSGDIFNETQLSPSAENLSEVLHTIQTNNRYVYDEINQRFRTIFPEIYEVGTRTLKNPKDEEGKKVGIFVWSIDPKGRRDDLSIPLEQSGTGISQILAMLYVVVTAEDPQIIIIDEPQSFLHPGAIRKLIDILKLYDKHQYIITTHSSTVISAANPSTLLHVTKHELVSSIQEINVQNQKEIELLLTDVGVRLSDVFGSDTILWVEGQTEEECIPLIIEKRRSEQFLGVKVLSVINTGDFNQESKKQREKQANIIFDIYDRLSRTNGLVPPAIGFIFDPEGKSKQHQDDLRRKGKGKVFFLPRRMYENYLLDSEALAHVIKAYNPEETQKLTSEGIDAWLDTHRWNNTYFPDGVPEDQELDDWYHHVHGANVLEALFKKFAGAGATYHKVTQGRELTEWLLEHNHDTFDEIVEQLDCILAAAHNG